MKRFLALCAALSLSFGFIGSASAASGLKQTITFTQPSNMTFGDADQSLSATSSSGLPVSFTSKSGAICSVAGGQVRPLASGSCVVAADQRGNKTYQKAPTVSRTFTISKKSQTITFTPAPSLSLASKTATLSAVSSSGLAVTYSTTTTSTCSLKGSTLTLKAVGSCSVKAAQSGDSRYAAAPTVTAAITINNNIPFVPRNFVAAFNVSGKIYVVWNAQVTSPPVTSYRASIYSAASGGSAVGTCNTALNNCVITGKSASTTYYANVQPLTGATLGANLATSRVATVKATAGQVSNFALTSSGVPAAPSAAGSPKKQAVAPAAPTCAINEEPRWPNYSPDGKYIAYTTNAPLIATDTNCGFDIYLLEVATGLLSLVSTNAAGIQPDNDFYLAYLNWSPDGQWLAFASSATNWNAAFTNPAQAHLYAKNIYSGELKTIDVTTSGVSANGMSIIPLWSSDSTSVRFYSEATNLVTTTEPENRGYRTLLKNMVTEEIQLLDKNPTLINYGPGNVVRGHCHTGAASWTRVWSGDSKFVIYTQLNDSFNCEAFALEISTGAVTRLGKNANGEYPASSLSNLWEAFAPTGSRVLTEYVASGVSSEMRVNDLDTGEAFRITGGNCASPLDRSGTATWFPDGSKIVYAAVGGSGGYDIPICVWDLNTGESNALVSAVTVQKLLVSPDGSQVLYDMWNSEKWSVNVASGDTRLLLELAFELYPAWSPDGSRIAYRSLGDLDLETEYSYLRVQVLQ